MDGRRRKRRIQTRIYRMGGAMQKKKRVESERFLIGFYKMLINRIFSRIKVSLLHSILVLQLLHLLAQLLRKRLFIERKTNDFLVDAEGNRQHRYHRRYIEGIGKVLEPSTNFQVTTNLSLTINSKISLILFNKNNKNKSKKIEKNNCK